MEEVKIYTSYHAKSATLKKMGFFVVSISVMQPKWANPMNYDKFDRRLAPYSFMLKLEHDEYYREFDKILEKLDPAALYSELQNDAKKAGKEKIALLCYEKDANTCHRRYVAKWFESNLGTVVEEVEFNSTSKKTPKPQQGSLFDLT